MPYPTTEMELTPAAFRGPAFPSIFVRVVGFLGPARNVVAPSSVASPSLKCDPRSQLDLPGAKQVGARSASGSETGLRKQRDATEHVLSRVDACDLVAVRHVESFGNQQPMHALLQVDGA